MTAPQGNKRRIGALAGCVLLLVVVAAGLFFWLGDGAEEARGLRARLRHPHIVLVSFDTLNVWYTSLFSEDGAPTPALEEVAADGVWFERAYTSVPITLPSHATLLTGRPPWSTGVLANRDVLPEDLRTLPELLSEHGYRTAAFLSLGVLGPQSDLDRGFDVYDGVPAQELGRFYRTADEVMAAATRWIERHAGNPFFAWVHLSDPHGPYMEDDEPADTELLLGDEVLGRWTLGRREKIYVTIDLPPGRHVLTWRALDHPAGVPRPTPLLTILDEPDLERWSAEPSEVPSSEQPLRRPFEIPLVNPGPEAVSIEIGFRGRWKERLGLGVRRRYRGEVSHADRHLGELRRLAERIGIGEDTLWVIVSDHGEGLFHHGAPQHAPHNREDQLRTLLLLDGPRVPEGLRLEAPIVLLQDVFATILDLLGLPAPEASEGRSLRECWGDGGCGTGTRQWIAYGLDRDRTLTSLSVYRWPAKALWSRKTEPGVFDLERHPREGRREHWLSPDPATLPGRAAAIDDPASSRLVRDLSRHIVAFQTILQDRQPGELDEVRREMLESLGYL